LLNRSLGAIYNKHTDKLQDRNAPYNIRRMFGMYDLPQNNKFRNSLNNNIHTLTQFNKNEVTSFKILNKNNNIQLSLGYMLTNAICSTETRYREK